jgi:hypothetical protein
MFSLSPFIDASDDVFMLCKPVLLDYHDYIYISMEVNTIGRSLIFYSEK